MKKPEKKIFKPVYEYSKIINYIEEKYKIQTRGYKPELDGEYRDFWHYCVRHGDIKNGCFMYLPGWDMDLKYDNSLWWVKEIMELIEKEFYPNENDWEDMKVWVEW